MFHGGDVCKILGYSESHKAIVRHCKYSKILRWDETSLLNLNPRGEYFIPESDVNRLIMRSNMPDAGVFHDWICEKVIPTLRKTGRYQIGPPEAQATVDLQSDVAPRS
jgi:prophage antirepressor-like protein